jgi:hypothetical protein
MFDHPSIPKIVSGHDLILREQPQENLNSRWNLKFPDRRKVDGLLFPEVDQSIHRAGRIDAFCVKLPYELVIFTGKTYSSTYL